MITGRRSWGNGKKCLTATVSAALTLGALSVAAPPSSAAGRTAARTTIDGVVRTLAADTVDHSAHPKVFKGHSEDIYRQVLVAGDKSYFLKGLRGPTNTRVRVTGLVTGNEIEATSISAGIETAEIPSAGTTHTLVMLAHWGAPDAVTPARASSQLFSDTNAWYRDASFGSLGQSGDVTPWLQITGPTTGCFADHWALMSQAKSAAAAAGYDVASYDNHILYFPYCAGDSSGFAGWAYVGSTGTWLNGYMDRRVTTHEEGHNYGLWHSHSYLCSGGGLTGSCSFSDYGDPYDAMGSSSYVGHFNASQKMLLGWMGDGRTVDLSQGGTTTLVPMADDSTSPHAALISVPNSSRKYWVEYRQPLDYDRWLPIDGTNGLLVHVSGAGSGSPDSGASLIDVSLSDGISSSTAALPAGASWTSPEGITITAGARNALSASVTVTSSSNCTVVGTEGNDILHSTGANDVICGFGGVDQVSYVNSPGPVKVNLSTRSATGHGNDTLIGIEDVRGSNYNDSIDGDAGNNGLAGYGGNDKVAGHEGNDTIGGGDGNDTVYLELGDDRGDGGPGVDTIIFFRAAVVANLTTGTATGEGTDTFNNFENLTGSAFSDTLTGSSLNNVIKGQAGIDTVYGLDGNDSLFGVAANDYLRGGIGNDKFNGGTGTDRCIQDTGTGSKTSCELS